MIHCKHLRLSDHFDHLMQINSVTYLLTSRSRSGMVRCGD